MAQLGYLFSTNETDNISKEDTESDVLAKYSPQSPIVDEVSFHI